MGSVPPHVTLIGAGQVGRALSTALRAQSVPHRILPFRRGLPRRPIPTDLVLLCVRDGQIPAAVERLIRHRWGATAVIAHVSGLLGLDVLSPLAAHCRGIGSLHPFSSIRALRPGRGFAGTYFVGDGNRIAMAMLRRLVGLLGGQFVRGSEIDRAKYHLAAALLANGSVALLHAAAQLLVQSGIPGGIGRKMLLELQRSVLHNVEKLGIEAALTGPVRRGDEGSLARHLEQLQDTDRATRELYRSLVRSQLDIVRGLGELAPRDIRRLSRILAA